MAAVPLYGSSVCCCNCCSITSWIKKNWSIAIVLSMLAQLLEKCVAWDHLYFKAGARWQSVLLLPICGSYFPLTEMRPPEPNHPSVERRTVDLQTESETDAVQCCWSLHHGAAPTLCCWSLHHSAVPTLCWSLHHGAAPTLCCWSLHHGAAPTLCWSLHHGAAPTLCWSLHHGAVPTLCWSLHHAAVPTLCLSWGWW